MKHKESARSGWSVILTAVLVIFSMLAPQAGRGHSLAASPAAAQGIAQAVPTWQQANESGFGASAATSVSALSVFGNYLYAGTHNEQDGARIFRTQDGATWTPVTNPGFGVSPASAPRAILDLTVFEGRLYASTGGGLNPGQVWRSLNGTTWVQVVAAGFANAFNDNITTLVEYDGKLYAGVRNRESRAQIWRSDSGASNDWTQVTPVDAAENPATITGMAVYSQSVYAVVESVAPAQAAQVWRSFGGDWEIALSNGFGDPLTTRTGGIVAFAGSLYVGAGNTASGAQIWRSSDGDTWQQIIEPGFGDANNLEVESLFVFNGMLYAGVQNGSGMEVWRSGDGTTWERANLDGFGNSDTTGTNQSSATVAFGDSLFVGTVNTINGGGVWRMAPQPHGVALSSAAPLSGVAGTQVVYSLTVTNMGTVADTFTLTAGAHTWPVTLPAALGPLAPGASASFNVAVTIPAGKVPPASDNVTVTATSQGDTTRFASTVLTTSAVAVPPTPSPAPGTTPSPTPGPAPSPAPGTTPSPTPGTTPSPTPGTTPDPDPDPDPDAVYGVKLARGASGTGAPGTKVVYTLVLTNTGSVSGGFALTISNHKWSTSLSAPALNVAPGASASVDVSVTVPADAVPPASDSVTVTATSQGDTTKSASVAFLTTAAGVPTHTIYLSLIMSGPSK